jgi:hypothetical protein
MLAGRWPKYHRKVELRARGIRGQAEALSTDFQFAMNLMKSIEMRERFSRMVFWFDE